MFDIGFWELLLIAVMGLVVLGPERLPVAIRAVRGWLSSIRQFSDTVKTELKEELRVEELHKHLKVAEQANMKNLSPEVEASLNSLKEAAAMVNTPYKPSSNERVENENVSDAVAPNEKNTSNENIQP